MSPFTNGCLFGTVLLVLTGSVCPAAAHNGAVAIAVPVEGIKVDGDLSDWPERMRRYPIGLRESGVKPRDAEDFQGNYRIGYNAQENALYVAVEVQDESTVIDTIAGAAAWDTQDGCDVYVDIAHTEKDTSGVQYVVWGNRRGVYGRGALTDVEVGVQRKEKTQQYEWRLDLGRTNRGQVRLHSGMTVGVDVVVADKDSDGSFSWMAWGRGTEKVTFTERMGDVVLVEADARIGRLKGRIKWEGVEEGVAWDKVRVQSLAFTELWVEGMASQQGVFAVDLPAGGYRVEVTGRERESRQGVVVEVREEGEEEVELVRSTPQGVTVTAGKGRTAEAGAGIRQGLWQTLDASDGLPSSDIRKIYQDRQEHLWFGTDRGSVSRYDGEQFTTFTTEDGLAGNTVYAIAEDQQGNLWFGTESGVSRYDGKQFTTFTTEDGLTGKYVLSMLGSAQGLLWFGTESGVSRYDGEQFTTFTTEDGLAGNVVNAIAEDQQGNLWFGTESGVSRYDGRQFTTLTTVDGLADNEVLSIAEDAKGNLWFGAWEGGVSRYDGKQFTTFTTKDGLAGNSVRSMLEDRQGSLWFGTLGGGVSRYDEKGLVTFTTMDGLAGNSVRSMLEDQQGSLWFGTLGGGVSRYDEKGLVTFTTMDGLASNEVQSILEDRQGQLWVGTLDGVSRYNGVRFVSFNTNEGLTNNNVKSIAEDRQGHLWFGTYRGGVSRYDGEQFTTFTTKDGLADNRVYSILADRDGQVWFGTQGGVSRFDGGRFTTFTTQDGLAGTDVLSLLEDRQGQLWVGTLDGVSRYDGVRFTTQEGLAGNDVRSMAEDRQGDVWFGTWEGGASRYDGKQFTTFTTKDGLADNRVYSILADRDGQVWFGTQGGVSRFDGFVFQNLHRQDGLVYNSVRKIIQDHRGNIWIATEGGITRYRPGHTPPPIQVTDVMADHRYGPVQEIRLPSSQGFISFAFQGISFKTRPGQVVYVYRLEGYDKEWKQTRENRVEYPDLPTGEYTFQVKAVDRDLTYSEVPAVVRIIIHPPYGHIALVGGLGLALVGLVFASGTAIRRHRAFLCEQQARLQAQEQLNQELEKELQTAHEMQMGLMPKAPPRIEGFQVTGRCIPANHVGGDLFQYFHQHDRLSISLADVTGHAMEAAIPVVMFSGILRSHMGTDATVEELFGKLNQALHGTLTGHTLVCLAMGQLDPSTRRFRFSNAGCPYPYYFKAATGEVVELRIDAYPLGVRPDTAYRGIEVQLEPGDRVVFCSDGIIEAANGAGEMFGFERTAETIRRGCAEDLSAEALLERIVAEVTAFRGEMPQGDDQTVVVMAVEQ